MHLRLSWILLVLACLIGCTPSQDSGADPRLYDTVAFRANVSRLVGDGGKLADNHYFSNIIWKDSNGIERSLEALLGNVIVLNMWATWCGPCVAEMPALQDIADEYAGDDVIVIGVSIDHAREPFKSVYDYSRLLGINYQLVVDSAARVYLNYGGDSFIPKTYFIDRDGYIQYIFNGQASKEQFAEVIEALL